MVELVLRLGLSLGIVLGLFWVIARTSSRRMAGARTPLRVLGRQSLSRNASLAVVEVGGRVLVVGVGEGGVKLLTELDPAEVGAAAEIAEPGTSLAALAGDDADPYAPQTVPPAVPPTVAGKRRAAVAPTPVAGSILAPDTWKTAWAAATGKGAGQAARTTPTLGS